MIHVLPHLMISVLGHRDVEIAAGESRNHLPHLRYRQPQCEAKKETFSSVSEDNPARGIRSNIISAVAHGPEPILSQRAGAKTGTGQSAEFIVDPETRSEVCSQRLRPTGQ